MRFFFLLLLCTTTVNSFAQQKYIEVNVSDTVLAEPDYFIYQVFLTEGSAEEDTLRYTDPLKYVKEKSMRGLKQQKILDSVRKALTAAGFRVLSPGLDEMYKIPYGEEEPTYSLRVLTGSVDSLRLLFNKIKGNTATAGFLDIVRAQDEGPARQRLYNKLIVNSRVKAEMIAAFTHQKITSILSVTEDKEEHAASGGWTAYPPLSSFSGRYGKGWLSVLDEYRKPLPNGNTMMVAYPIMNALTVRFEVE